jgi:hypothetical protein
MRLLFFILGIGQLVATAQITERTVGVTAIHEGVYDAYTLFSPAHDSNVYLIDNCGALVHKWVTDKNPGNAVYLMEDGSLWRAGQLNNTFINAGGAGGIIEKFDWEGNRTWSYTYSSSEVRAHHDFQVLPNGNVLILAWETYSRSEAEQNGMNPNRLDIGVSEIWPEHIIEVEPNEDEGGTIVWEWHVWDHLIQDFDEQQANYGIIADHPGKIDINHVRPGKTQEDWQHANAINYNAELDQILLSVLYFDEIWIIDHSTTTEEAKGERGDLIYRWGNPQAYDHGDATDQKLFGQHNAQFIPQGLPDEGKLLIFNNGQERFPIATDLYSSVVKIDPIMSGGTYEVNSSGKYLPEDYYYEYTKVPPTDFYSRFISGAQQLPNGNILIDDGAHGTFFEIDEEEKIVWEYVNPITIRGPLKQGQLPTAPNGSGINTVFRATKYAPDYPAFTRKDLTPSNTIEIDGDFSICEPLEAKPKLTISVFPNPANNVLNIIGAAGQFRLIDMHGRLFKEGDFHNLTSINISDLNDGLYILSVNGQYMEKIIISR